VAVGWQPTELQLAKKTLFAATAVGLFAFACSPCLKAYSPSPRRGSRRCARATTMGGGQRGACLRCGRLLGFPAPVLYS
jgi:hypothetical protein